VSSGRTCPTPYARAYVAVRGSSHTSPRSGPHMRCCTPPHDREPDVRLKDLTGVVMSSPLSARRPNQAPTTTMSSLPGASGYYSLSVCVWSSGTEDARALWRSPLPDGSARQLLNPVLHGLESLLGYRFSEDVLTQLVSFFFSGHVRHLFLGNVPDDSRTVTTQHPRTHVTQRLGYRKGGSSFRVWFLRGALIQE
jgi:hypothetical protein